MADLNNVTMNDVLNKSIDGYRPWFPDTVPTHKIAEAVIATLAEHDRKVKADALMDAADGLETGAWPADWWEGVRGAARELRTRASIPEDFEKGASDE